MERRTRITLLLDKVTFEDKALRKLGYIMAFIAGAVNAGGFFAIGYYTSHVTGEVSAMADHLILGDIQLVILYFCMLLCFIGGAMHSTWLIIWARRSRFRSSYGISMCVESFILLVFGILGITLGTEWNFLFFSPTIMLLCFIMGMHNTVITILSNGLLRSTHMTGIATDIGIELSKAMYFYKNPLKKVAAIKTNRRKLTLFIGILCYFFLGGVVGALGFRHLGFTFILPLAILLFIWGAFAVVHDLRARARLRNYKKANPERSPSN